MHKKTTHLLWLGRSGRVWCRPGCGPRTCTRPSARPASTGVRRTARTPACRCRPRASGPGRPGRSSRRAPSASGPAAAACPPPRTPPGPRWRSRRTPTPAARPRNAAHAPRRRTRALRTKRTETRYYGRLLRYRERSRYDTVSLIQSRFWALSPAVPEKNKKKCPALTKSHLWHFILPKNSTWLFVTTKYITLVVPTRKHKRFIL